MGWSNLRALATASLLLLFTVVTGVAWAADDLIAGSELDKIAEIARGYGSVKPAQTDDNGKAWLELRTEGQKYYLEVYSKSGKKCEGNCNLAFTVCGTSDQKPTFDEMNSWIADHWSVVDWNKDDGTCLSLYLLAYDGKFTQSQIEAAFDLWLLDYAAYRKSFQ